MAISAVKEEKIKAVEESGKPDRTATFQPKKKRKAIRRGMFAEAYRNKVADMEIETQKRKEFRRKIKLVKLRRDKLATLMRSLETMMGGLQREVVQLGDRIVGVDMGLVDETNGLVKKAAAAVGGAAEDLGAFAKTKVEYRKAA
ncbi:MAG: hypothetical protein ABIQ18_31985 [Umezawaea sp.]